PQSGQKRNVRSSPSSDVRTYSVERPTTRTRSDGNRACIPKALPVRRWQARQWHIEIRTGSPSAVRRSCPQLQAASRLCTPRSYSVDGAEQLRDLRGTRGARV